MSNLIIHPYHLVDESPWPIQRALGAFFLTNGFIMWFFQNSSILIILALISLILTSFSWWRDITFEARNQGLHTGIVELGLRWGILLFIVSEIFFFLSFFWCYFHVRLAPSIEIGGIWPPLGINTLNPIDMPLVNTLVLVTSGVTITWSHHAILKRATCEGFKGLLITVILGVLFTFLQLLEYIETRFSMADRVYGSIFFLATGFHGFHVLVGTIFLYITLRRYTYQHIRANHHFGFEAAAWYWHFVDVVWLFLYLVIYWWGRI